MQYTFCDLLEAPACRQHAHRREKLPPDPPPPSVGNFFLRTGHPWSAYEYVQTVSTTSCIWGISPLPFIASRSHRAAQRVADSTPRADPCTCSSNLAPHLACLKLIVGYPMIYQGLKFPSRDRQQTLDEVDCQASWHPCLLVLSASERRLHALINVSMGVH